MLVSCSYCAGAHERSIACPRRPKKKAGPKEANHITRFRSLNIWRKKREEIKRRDLFLCQYCKTKGRYTFQGLEVHHIKPIAESWTKRLDNNNLITLCTTCHKLAENKNICSDLLASLAEK